MCFDLSQAIHTTGESRRQLYLYLERQECPITNKYAAWLPCAILFAEVTDQIIVSLYPLTPDGALPSDSIL